MTTKAERQAHREAGMRASDFPLPPAPLMHPNAEWCESYARWHSQFVAASRRPAVDAAPDLTETAKRIAWAIYDTPPSGFGYHNVDALWGNIPEKGKARYLSAARAVSAPAAAPGGVEEAIARLRKLEEEAEFCSNATEGVSPRDVIDAVQEVVRLLSASPAAPAAQGGSGWSIVGAKHKDELVSIHGPGGLITGGLTMEQATALVEAHGSAPAAQGGEIIDINGPNRAWGKHHVEVALQLWDNRKVFSKEVGGNCIGWPVIDSAIDQIIDDIAMNGRVILTSPDGEELTVDDEADDSDWDERIRKMVVSARITGYTPPTLNEVRAQNGAPPVEGGDAPRDYDAEIVARRKSENAAEIERLDWASAPAPREA